MERTHSYCFSWKCHKVYVNDLKWCNSLESVHPSYRNPLVEAYVTYIAARQSGSSLDTLSMDVHECSLQPWMTSCFYLILRHIFYQHHLVGLSELTILVEALAWQKVFFFFLLYCQYPYILSYIQKTIPTKVKFTTTRIKPEVNYITLPQSFANCTMLLCRNKVWKKYFKHATLPKHSLVFKLYLGLNTSFHWQPWPCFSQIFVTVLHCSEVLTGMAIYIPAITLIQFPVHLHIHNWDNGWQIFIWLKLSNNKTIAVVCYIQQNWQALQYDLHV